MNFLLNPKIGLTIILFSLMRFADMAPTLKGALFIICSLTLIYLSQKNYSKKLLIYILSLLTIFIFINEKKSIEELSLPLKLNENNDEIYLNIFDKEKFTWIKSHYLEFASDCYADTKNCFQNSLIDDFNASSDQLFFNFDNSISRKVNDVNFSSLANARFSFINAPSGNINYKKIHKLDTPYFVQYSALEHISNICFKGLVFVNFRNNDSSHYNHINKMCISGDFETFLGINLPGKNLEVEIISNEISKYNDELILFLFLIILIFNIDKSNLKREIKLFIPILLSTFIIFYISKYDNWFEIFNLFTFYFFGFEGGDGKKYLDFTSIIYHSFLNYNLFDLLKGGENVFYFTPGLRYFLFINQIISGDYYYLYFFFLFFLPKVFHNFFKTQFNSKISYFIFISFLLIPIFHHLGFSYYQYIRHAYRLFPESIGYLFFIAALTIFLNNFKKDYLKMNLLFALSVFFRPNLVVSIVAIVLTKTIIEKVNIFKIRYLIMLSLISLIYLFPLFHNIYFGNSFTLFTSYGSKILSIENILSKDLSFYQERFISINILFLFLIFVPTTNNYFKIILITQYITIFWFDLNDRYYWIFWLMALIMSLDIIMNKINKWQYLKKYI